MLLETVLKALPTSFQSCFFLIEGKTELELRSFFLTQRFKQLIYTVPKRPYNRITSLIKSLLNLDQNK